MSSSSQMPVSSPCSTEVLLFNIVGQMELSEKLPSLVCEDDTCLRVVKPPQEHVTQRRLWHVIPGINFNGEITNVRLVTSELPDEAQQQDKCHLVGRVVEVGKPITFILTAGQRHEAVVFEQLLGQGEIKRSGWGRPRLRPKRIVGDKGYSSGSSRRFLRRRGNRVTIPRRSNERRRGKFDREVYRQRNLVELTINRLKQFRRVAARYEK